MNDRRNGLFDDLVGAMFLGIFIWLAARFWKVTLSRLLVAWVIALVIDIRDDSDGNATQGYVWLTGLMLVVGGVMALRHRERRRRQRVAQQAIERRLSICPDRVSA